MLDTDLNDETAVRRRVALAVLAIVARYADAEPGFDAGDVDADPVQVERRVRELAPEALAVTRDRRIVTADLADEYLLDDFTRIREVEQHDAFGFDMTDAEQADHLAYLDARAQDAADSAAWWEHQRREGTRVCGRCHRTRSGHPAPEAWPGLAGIADPGCRNFSDVEDHRCTGVPVTALEAAARSRALRSYGQVPEADMTDLVAAVVAVATDASSSSMTVGQAITAGCAVVGMVPTES